MYKILLSWLILLLTLPSISGQETEEYFIINTVHLNGNKKTRDYIVLREMDLLPGAKIKLEDLANRILLNEKRILSTGLFNYTKIEISNWNTGEKTADIKVILQENWYIYPVPIFELADRNFNVWWKEQNRSLDRVNYGLSLDHINLTGNYDRLKLKLQFGYTRKYEMKYDFRYLKNGRWGFETNTVFSESREVGYITDGNKSLFFRANDDRRLRSRFRSGVAMSHRPDPFFSQTFKLEFHRNTIDDEVANSLNHDYFEGGANSLKFFLLSYDTQLDRRVLKFYPQGGYRLTFNVKKEGLGIFNEFDNLSITAGYETYAVLGNVLLGTNIRAKTNLTRQTIAFANNTGLGYNEDLVRGYELYVIDGTDWVLARSHASIKILETIVDNRFMPIRQFKKLDFKVYLRWMTDVGYVNEPTYRVGNPLNNRFLIGYGPALDFIFFNTVWLNVEYNFNHLGEGGFYIKSRNAF